MYRFVIDAASSRDASAPRSSRQGRLLHHGPTTGSGNLFVWNLDWYQDSYSIDAKIAPI